MPLRALHPLPHTVWGLQARLRQFRMLPPRRSRARGSLEKPSGHCCLWAAARQKRRQVPGVAGHLKSPPNQGSGWRTPMPAGAAGEVEGAGPARVLSAFRVGGLEGPADDPAGWEGGGGVGHTALCRPAPLPSGRGQPGGSSASSRQGTGPGVLEVLCHMPASSQEGGSVCSPGEAWG